MRALRPDPGGQPPVQDFRPEPGRPPLRDPRIDSDQPPQAHGRRADAVHHLPSRGPAVHRGGPPSDPLGLDPRLVAEWDAEASGGSPAWESFDSWVSANQSPTEPPSGRPHHPDDTGIHPAIPESGRRRAPEPPSHGGRRHRADEDLQQSGRRRAGETTGSHQRGRSVDDLLASYGDHPDTRPRRRREA